MAFCQIYRPINRPILSCGLFLVANLQGYIEMNWNMLIFYSAKSRI